MEANPRGAFRQENEEQPRLTLRTPSSSWPLSVPRLSTLVAVLRYCGEGEADTARGVFPHRIPDRSHLQEAEGLGREMVELAGRYFFSSAALNDRSFDRRCVMSRARARSRSEPLASSTPRASSCRTKSSNRSEASASRKVKRLYPMSHPCRLTQHPCRLNAAHTCRFNAAPVHA